MNFSTRSRQNVVAVLLWRRLHEVGAGRGHRAGDAPVERDLRRAYRVDDHPGGVGRVPDLELVLQVERHVAERAALEPDVGHLPVIQPRHVVGRADVHGGALHLVRDLRGHRLGLGDLLRLEPLALQHVHEVHVAAEVQLVGAEQFDPAVLEQLGQHAVRDGGADLGLDVVADDRDAGAGELGGPFRVRGDEHRQRVDEGDVRVDRALGVVAVRLLGADGQVGDHDVGAGLAQRGGHVHGRLVGLGDDLPVVLAEAVQGRATLDDHASRRDLGNLDGVVLAGVDGVGEIAPDLLRVHVERGDHLDVADVVGPEPDMHEAGDPGTFVGVLVILQSLHQGASAVTHPHDGDAHLTHQDDSFSEMLSGPPACRSDAISSFSHRTSRSTDSRPCRCSSRV